MLYPTETFFAIGCLANNGIAARLVAALKNRPKGKPMPLLAASMEQAALAARLDEAPKRLLRMFWPGPLSIILPAMPNVAPPLRSPGGRAAIRASSNPIAAELAAKSGWPLAASSANFSGYPPSPAAACLDPRLVDALAASGASFGILSENAAPPHSKPSTIVEPCGGKALILKREGAISRRALLEAGFIIRQA